MPGRLWGENFNVKHEKMQVILYIVGKLLNITKISLSFWGPQKHIMEAPFLRFWDFTVFVATASASNP